jgi:Methyltransferase domain
MVGSPISTEEAPVSTSTHHDYWDSFYAGKTSGDVPGEPSAFALSVLPDMAPDQPVVEFGFGTGRDALWFAQQGHQVLGLDFSEAAVARAQGQADGHGLSARFGFLDLYDDDGVAASADELLSTLQSPAIYGRFLIHSLEEAGRRNLLDLSAKVLADGGELYLEFRTGKDAGHQHVFGDDHFRVYLAPTLVAEEIVERGGSVIRLEEGHGFAVYKSEDPHVARLVATFAS